MNRMNFAAKSALAALLAVGICWSLPVVSNSQVQAQESEATPSPEQRPVRGAGDGAGRRAGGQSGSRGDGSNRPVQPESPPSEDPPQQMPAEQASPVSERGAPEPAGVEASEAVRSSDIVAIAGIDGATLTDRPQGLSLYIVPMGTAMQVVGRTDNGKWLYVTRDAVSKGGKEVEPALAGWTPKVDVIAFSIDNLPVLDSDDIQIMLPDPMTAIEGPQADDVDGEPVTLAENPTDMAIESGSEKNANTIEVDDVGDDVDIDVDGNGIVTIGVVNLDDSRLNVRSGPGTATAMAGKLLPGETVTLLGRTEDAAWLLVTNESSPALVGWVAADFIELDVEPETLPVFSSALDSLESVSAGATTTDELPVGVAVVDAMPSPSGDLLVLQPSPGATFYAYDLDSGALWPLSRGFDPAISPDGGTVAFTRDGGENGIYLVDIDGGNERQIFAERGRLASPKWSPDGEWIVFSRGNTFAECYQLGRTCLTASQIREKNPNIDLGKLELVREPRYHLAMVDAKGDNYTDIAALDTARTPDWIDAGIVYQSSAGLQITGASADVENRLVIDDYLKPYFHDPDWQPGLGAGGGRIAYMGKEGSHWEIFTVNPDGSSVTALTRPSTTLAGELPSNVAPAWSPDGSQIAFLSNRANGGGSDVWRLWIMDADGSNQRPLDIDLEMDYTFGDEQVVGW